MGSVRSTAVLLVVVGTLNGCTLIHKDIDYDFRSAAELWLGSNPSPGLDDALSALGPPLSITAMPGGYALLYQHFDIHERQIGVNSEQPFLRWFKLSLADADGEKDTLMLHFNNDDQLIASRLYTQEEDYGEGGSVMFALSFVSIVDTSDLHESLWGMKSWGVSLLQSPIVAQNRQSSLDSGQSGLEQRGTPANVGQRTLE
jgi:hypothetical protein